MRLVTKSTLKSADYDVMIGKNIDNLIIQIYNKQYRTIGLLPIHAGTNCKRRNLPGQVTTTNERETVSIAFDEAFRRDLGPSTTDESL